MFKYLAQILAQFSMTQRIMALLIILFSVIILTLTPKFLDAFTQDNGELWETVNQQSSQITQMRGEITRLNGEIINNERECTNEIIRREKEILDMIGNLENKMERTRPRANIIYNGMDTIMMTPLPTDNSMMTRELKNIKKNIKNHIDGINKN